MENEIYDALSAIADKNINGKDAVIRELKDQIHILKDQLSLMKSIIVSTNPNTNTKVRFSKINQASLYGYSESSNSECQFVENGDKHNINSEFRCQEHSLLDSDITPQIMESKDEISNSQSHGRISESTMADNIDITESVHQDIEIDKQPDTWSTVIRKNREKLNKQTETLNNKRQAVSGAVPKQGQRQGRRRLLVVGDCADSDAAATVKGVEKSVHLHVYRIDPNTSATEFKEYLSKKFPEVEVEQLNS
ncbi:hypothetical protein C0J52_24753 [Blattella germanica]|nr:hypothetical protein C0J52_24753 [Blattella germanica]